MVGLAAVDFGAAAGAAVDRAGDPIITGRRGADGHRWIAAVDVFHDVGFAAGWPVDGGDVVAEEPEGRPHTLGFGEHHARFDASVLKAEQAFGFEAGARAAGGEGLHDNGVAGMDGEDRFGVEVVVAPGDGGGRGEESLVLLRDGRDS